MSKSTLEKDAILDASQLYKASEVIRTINHRLRQQILRLLHQKGQMTVTELYIKLRKEQSTTSQHLALLRHAGFVIATRHGRYMFYSVNYRRLEEVQRITADLLNPVSPKDNGMRVA